MFIVDHKHNVIQQDHGGAGSREHVGCGLWHILCNNSFVLFSGRRAPARMLCLVWDLVLQGRDRLLEMVRSQKYWGCLIWNRKTGGQDFIQTYER